MISLYKKEKLYDDMSSSCKKFLEEFGCDEVLVDETTQTVKIRKNCFHEDDELITSLSDKDDEEKRLAFSKRLDYLQALHYCNLYKNYKLLWFIDDTFMSTLYDKLSCCQIVGHNNTCMSVRFSYTYPEKETPCPIQLDIYNKDIIKELFSMDVITIDDLYKHQYSTRILYKTNENLIRHPSTFYSTNSKKRESLLDEERVYEKDIIWDGPHYVAYIYNECGDMGRGRIPKILAKSKDDNTKIAKTYIQQHIKQNEKDIEKLKALLDANP